MQPSSVPQVLSVNVGQPRAVVWKGRMVVTGIFQAQPGSAATVLAVKALPEAWRDDFLQRLTQLTDAASSSHT